MKELINDELLQLQKDLENLKSASEMISQAGKASDAVIEETKNIHKEFTDSLDKLTELYKRYAEETIKKVTDLSVEKISEQTTLSKKSAEDSASKIELVKSTYLSQTAKTDKLLNSYLELAQSTTELKDKISGIDFPARLENISALISNLVNTQEKSNAEYEKIAKIISDNQALKQSQKNSKAISKLSGLLWVIMILLLCLIGAAAYLFVKTKGM